MIKINLLRERRAKKVPRGEQTLLVGTGIILATAACVFFFIHMPLSSSVDDLVEENGKLQRSITKLEDETKEFDAVQAQLNAARDQEEAIKRLNAARAVPAWMLAELSRILTKDHQPTMTAEMSDRIRSDANRQFTPGWDPKRVWITTIDEKDGNVTINGGAQAASDITQFALRLQASVFFEGITPGFSGSAVDGSSHLNYYNYTITGKVRY